MKKLPSILWALLCQLAGSKKFAALLAGLVAVALTKVLKLEPPAAKELGLQVAGLVSAYLVGQGIADHGKESKKLEIANGGSREA